MSTWTRLVEYLSSAIREERMYRGETRVTLKDVEELFKNLRKPAKGEIWTTDSKVLDGDPNPDGDVIEVDYPVDPRVWSRWSRSPNFASIMGTSKDDQHHGVPQGGTVHKTNYGGRVVYSPGKHRGDHERLASSMDTYDIMMVGEVNTINHPGVPATGNVTFNKETDAGIKVKKIAWSPAVGSNDERQERLKGLLMGGNVSLVARRPQPHRPDVPPDTQDNTGKWAATQRRGAGSRAPLPPAPRDAPKQGSGHMGMGKKFNEPPKKRDDED